VSTAFKAASERYHGHEPVDPSKKWEELEGDELHANNRVGNKTQIEEYCVPYTWRRRSRWGPKIVSRMFVASVLALMLQWGTAGAAIMDVWFTPTKGE